MDLLRTLASRNPEARLPVGLEEALIGIGSRDGRAVAIYDERRCLSILRASLSESEAHASLDAIRSVGGTGAPYFAAFAPDDRPLPSESVRAMIGTLTEDVKQSPLLTWATGQMRTGGLREAIDRYVAENPHCDPREVPGLPHRPRVSLPVSSRRALRARSRLPRDQRA